MGSKISNEATLSAFDAVVMLTWSNWETEPRSNRFHYASRFSRHLPVYFVQADSPDDTVRYEKSTDGLVTIVHVPQWHIRRTEVKLWWALRKLGVRRPLLWIYNVFFEGFIRTSKAPLKIYHATEDYFVEASGWAVTKENVMEPLKRVLQSTDMVVAVSDSLAKNYAAKSGFQRRVTTIRNGCDFEFWDQSDAATFEPLPASPKVALFQGGINARLDYQLLFSICTALPDWQFWFCGHTRDAGLEWIKLRKLSNVVYKGEIAPSEIAGLSKRAAVGIMPFKDDPLIRGSLPLKAYEYVACGLPVVTVPIDHLSSRPDLFKFAQGWEQFSSAIQMVAETRTDKVLLASRREAASLQSYDLKFDELCEQIAGIDPGTRASRTRYTPRNMVTDASWMGRAAVKGTWRFWWKITPRPIKDGVRYCWRLIPEQNRMKFLSVIRRR